MDMLTPIQSDELIPATQLARELTRCLETLQQNKKQKWALTRNGVTEAVLIRLKTFEELLALVQELKSALHPLSRREIVEKRLSDPDNMDHAISLDALGKKYGLKK